jgi:RHS repeat-associated protein
MRVTPSGSYSGTLYWIQGDQLGSASLTTNITGTIVSEQRYYPFGETRWVSRTMPTDRLFTGQKSNTLINLISLGAREYSPLLGRFISADTIVSDLGNPQSLNRYSYVFNRPLVFIDPSGHDPIDAAWREEFKKAHNDRDPSAEDILIRLFSIAFPDEWDVVDFYDKDNNFIPGSLERKFRDSQPADRSWAKVPGALQRLASWYKDGEEAMFTRDVGSLFGGLPNRSEEHDTWKAISDSKNPIRVWVYVSRGGISPAMEGTSDKDANIHHWAWGLTMGAEYGPGASFINEGREMTQFGGDWTNTWSDVLIGNAGAALGFTFRSLGIHNIAQSWSIAMMTWLP